jgi:hypothetical protein
MADGTAGPGMASDAFLADKWEKDIDNPPQKPVHLFQKTAGPYETVVLHNFKFLGATFRPSTYFGRVAPKGALVPGETHTGAGVCAEFKDILVKAQHDIFKAYAAEVTGLGQVPSESGFASWCNIQDLVGWQFRGGQHRRGSAIDIEPTFNPYVATKTGNTFGGEEYKGDSSDPATVILHNDPLLSGLPNGARVRAVEAYGHAWELRFGPGKVPDVSGFRTNNPGETLEQAYDRFFDLHTTLITYFDLAFLAPSKTTLQASDPGQQRSFGDQGQDPASFLSMVNVYRPNFFKFLPTKTAELRALFDKVRTDYDRMRLVMVTGALTKSAPPNAGFAGSGLILPASRDPRRGFLRIRKQIAVILRQHVKRWGALDFGAAANGDIMHFDRGLDTEAPVATVTDPNPNNIFYASK